MSVQRLPPLALQPGKRVAIVGGGRSRLRCPLWLPGERWGINYLHGAYDPEENGQFSRWFNIHRRAHLERDHALPDGALRFARHLPQEVPYYVGDPEPWWDVPASRPFPADELMRAGGPFHWLPPIQRAYHCSSFDWCVALALSEGFGALDVYGFDMRDAEEPPAARACMEWWLGLAAGLGATITVAEPTDLFWAVHTVHTRQPYGVTDWKPLVVEGE